jgi:hypothetical protein
MSSLLAIREAGNLPSRISFRTVSSQQFKRSAVWPTVKSFPIERPPIKSRGSNNAEAIGKPRPGSNEVGLYPLGGAARSG